MSSAELATLLGIIAKWVDDAVLYKEGVSEAQIKNAILAVLETRAIETRAAHSEYLDG